MFLLWYVHFGARPRVPPGCCGGRHLERGVQETEKTLVKPLASPQPRTRSSGDVPDLDSGKAAEIAKDRERCKSLRRSMLEMGWYVY